MTNVEYSLDDLELTVGGVKVMGRDAIRTEFTKALRNVSVRDVAGNRKQRRAAKARARKAGSNG